MIEYQRAPDGSLAVFDVVDDDAVGRVLRYRYCLERPIPHDLFEDIERTKIVWVMLNPSTADAFHDDPTVMRCWKRSKERGRTRLVVVNAFALRATDPRELRTEADPIGPDNLHWIEMAVRDADEVVIAWGGSWPRAYHDHMGAVLEIVRPHRPLCLGRTNNGDPRHPLYVAYRTELEVY